MKSLAMENPVVHPDDQTESLRLSSNPDDISHLVCCWQMRWRTSFCGAQGDTVSMAAETLCTMCAEQAEVMWPGVWADPESFCLVDGQACPDEHDVDLRIAWETGPPQA
ncbi:hypothetical protein ADL21_35765 [Streptomyces albus subsp. albus]|nr:hypothetical protein ADL21_35765 [Streptomyces albus subsp. albus]